jgi:hypothetical protein
LLRLGILVAFGLALLEAVAAVGLAAVGRGALAWVAALVTLALSTYTFGVALTRLLGPPAVPHVARHAATAPARLAPEARLARLVARRHGRWAGIRAEALPPPPGAAPTPSAATATADAPAPAGGLWARVRRAFGREG